MYAFAISVSRSGVALEAISAIFPLADSKLSEFITLSRAEALANKACSVFTGKVLSFLRFSVMASSFAVEFADSILL